MALAASGFESFAVYLEVDPSTDPGYGAAVRRRLAEPDLVDRVVVHGLRTPAEVVGFYRAADVFALASVRDPYGTVYSEAMAVGLPVVGWAAGNLPHLARLGVTRSHVSITHDAGVAVAVVILESDSSSRCFDASDSSSGRVSYAVSVMSSIVRTGSAAVGRGSGVRETGVTRERALAPVRLGVPSSEAA